MYRVNDLWDISQITVEHEAFMEEKSFPLNVTTAGISKLIHIPGVSIEDAEIIIEDRQKHSVYTIHHFYALADILDKPYWKTLEARGFVCWADEELEPMNLDNDFKLLLKDTENHALESLLTRTLRLEHLTSNLPNDIQYLKTEQKQTQAELNLVKENEQNIATEFNLIKRKI
jgi:hypothetical protein